MNRRHWITRVSGLIAASALPFEVTAAGNFPLKKSPAEWKKILSPEAYLVLFEEGTERAGSSPLDGEKRAGTFLCAACNQPLFDSAKKYDSGTGWPSFWEPLPGAVATSTDESANAAAASGKGWEEVAIAAKKDDEALTDLAARLSSLKSG